MIDEMRVPRLASQPDRLYSEYCCAAGEFTLPRLRGNAVVTAARDVYKTARRCDISEDRPDAEPPTDEPAEDAEDAETFPASVVGDLRKESAGYRERAKGAEARADELARKLHLEPVRGTARLADPTDLSYDGAHLDDADALTAAIDALTDAKPHLKARRPSG